MWNRASYQNWTIIYKSSEVFTPYTHSHYDFLHFILLDNNRPLLIDSGRGSYDPSNTHYASYLPQYHNSLIINDLSYKPYNALRYPPTYFHYKCTSEIDQQCNSLIIKLYTDGFNRIKPNFNLSRTIEISKLSVKIIDNINDASQYIIENYFHIDSRFNIIKKNKNIYFNEKYQFSSNNLIDQYSINKQDNFRLDSENYGDTNIKNYLSAKNNISSLKPVIHEIKKL